jgi:hypothetical protein
MDRVAVVPLIYLRAAGVALGLLALTACATTPEREGPVPLAAGDRVRVTLASRVATGRLQGTVVSVSPDTLVVAREEGGERRLSRAQIEEVEISVSRAAEPLKAAGYGVLAAAPLVLLLVLVVPFAAGEGGTSAVLGFVLVPVAAAAGLGGAIGSGPQDAWVKADWPSQSASALSESFPADSH